MSPRQRGSALLLGTLAFILLLTSGCHLIFRYEDDPGPSPFFDAGRKKDQAPRDRDTRDILDLAPPPPPDIPTTAESIPPPPDGPPTPPDGTPPPQDQGTQPVWWQMTSGTQEDLHGVWAVSATSVFAVGDEGVVLHYDGNTLLKWKTLDTYKSLGSNKSDLRAVHGLGAKALVVGNDGADLLCTSTSCGPSTFRGGMPVSMHWTAVWCDSKGDCYAGGRNNSGSKAYLYRMNANTWWWLCGGETGSFLGTEVFGLSGLDGSSAPTIYSVGTSGRINYGGMLGIGCGKMGSTGVTASLRSVWTMPGAPLYVVGDKGTSSGMLLSYEAAKWTNLGGDIKVNLRGVWGDAKNSVWVVGDSGFVRHLAGAQWNTYNLQVTKDLHAVHGTGPKDVYAVGKGGTIMRFN